MFSREDKDVALSVSGVLVAECTWKAVSAGCLGLTPSQWAKQTGISWMLTPPGSGWFKLPWNCTLRVMLQYILCESCLSQHWKRKIQLVSVRTCLPFPSLWNAKWSFAYITASGFLPPLVLSCSLAWLFRFSAFQKQRVVLINGHRKWDSGRGWFLFLSHFSTILLFCQ